MKESKLIEWISLSNEVDVAHIGPPLEKGKFPTVFYLALSAEESLGTDPYNQPALLLAKRGIRVFSLNLPAHGSGLSSLNGIDAWATAFSEGQDPLSPFLDQLRFAINALIEKGLILKEKVGLMGLSRGGFMALHSLVNNPRVHCVTCFSPLIALKYTKEFIEKSALVPDDLKLDTQISWFVGKSIRLYIGNRDTRVGTRMCFEFVYYLANTSYNQGVRSPYVEMIINPSTGHMGHGTSEATFYDGAAWMAQKLKELW